MAEPLAARPRRGADAREDARDPTSRRRSDAADGGGLTMADSVLKIGSRSSRRKTASASRPPTTRGGKSTLCAGCGHDAISNQIIRAFYEMSVKPEKVAKFSGIGCSSKTPGLLPLTRARLQRRARPHAGRGHRRDAGEPEPARRSASPATATPPRSASASSCTWSAATSRSSTSSRTTACTA